MPSDPREIVSSLLDVPGLENLYEVCRKHGVSLTCHGSTVRRIAAAASNSENRDDWDIFDCVPFSSDIDLVHSGSSDQTAPILRDIHQAVPFAEQLRWELISREERAPFEEAKLYSAIIPAVWIELNTREGWVDPWDGLSDISTGTFRFIRNGFYSRSPLFNAGRDVELMSALMYYKSMLDMPGVSPEPSGLAMAVRIVEEAATGQATTIRFQESAYLRSRLRYSLTSIKASAPERLRPSAPLFSAWGLSQLGPLLQELGGAAELLNILNWEPQQGHLSVSSRIGGDLYRLPAVSADPWDSDAAALESFATTMGEMSSEREISLDSGQKLMLSSQPIRCQPGVAPSSQDSEFIHMCVKTDKPIGVSPEDLSAVCVVHMSGQPAVALAAPTACSTPAQNDGGYLSVRCNLGRALSTRDNTPGRVVRVFVTQLMEQEDGAQLKWTR